MFQKDLDKQKLIINVLEDIALINKSKTIEEVLVIIDNIKEEGHLYFHMTQGYHFHPKVITFYEEISIEEITDILLNCVHLFKSQNAFKAKIALTIITSLIKKLQHGINSGIDKDAGQSQK